VYITSFNPLVLYRLKRIDKNIRTVWDFMDTNWDTEILANIQKKDQVDLPWYLRKEITRRAIRKIIKPDALDIHKNVDEKVINTLLEKGYPVLFWTVNKEAEIKWALQKHPYGMITDEPILTKQLRDEFEQ
jgi:glycerophosphoryl diester phosphodiesterase